MIGFIKNQKIFIALALRNIKTSNWNWPAHLQFRLWGLQLRRKIPGIADYFRLHSYSDSYVVTNQLNGDDQKVFNERNVFFADPPIVNHLSLSILQGAKDLLLTKPATVVISESAARKYFGEKEFKAGDLIGRTLSLDGNGMQTVTMTVEGIFEDFPDNAHIHFDFIISHSTITDLYIPSGAVPEKQRLTIIDTSWGPPQWYTYVVLSPRVKPGEIADKITDFMQKRNKAEHTYENYRLQSISAIHLHSNLRNEPSINGNIRNVRFLAFIALIILLIAWINYINLSTAKALERAKEVGLRKIAGAGRWQLTGQFLFESLMLNLFALLLALGAFHLGMPYFEAVTATNYPAMFSDNFVIMLAVFMTLTIGGFLAGIYPALVLSQYNPVLVLKGKFISHGKGAWLRRVLVIFQFTLSVAMMVATVAIYKQNEFMLDRDLGINIDQTLVIKSPEILPASARSFQGALEAFRNEAGNYQRILNIASANMVPGRLEGLGEHIKRMEFNELDTREMKIIAVDHQYFDNLGIKLAEGRNFMGDVERNKGKIILNEAALQYLGFEKGHQVIGSKLGIAYHAGFNEYDIIGVVSDFHQTSLKNEIEPLAFYSFPGPGYYLIKLNTGDDPGSNIKESVGQVEKTFKNLFPGNPFEYFFLDDFFDRQYQSDLRFSTIFSIFAILALLIASLGLFGLSSLTVLRRTREIGIRKTLGASIKQIFGLLSIGFLKVILVANIIALPLVFFGIKEWLDNYPYKTTLEWWFFIIPSAAILMIAMVTVSFQTLKAALTDPVKVLKQD